MTTKTTKKEFAWDKEVLLDTIYIGEKEKRQIRICELKEKQFVSFTTLKFIKDAWMVTGGYTVPKQYWCDVVDTVQEYNMASAFEGCSNVIIAKKTTVKKSKKDGAK